MGMYLEEKSACWFHNVVCRNKSSKLSDIAFKGSWLGWLMVGWAAPWDQLQGGGEVGKGAHLLPSFCALVRGGHEKSKLTVPVWG